MAQCSPDIRIDGESIPEVNIARLLGVWINRRGEFTVHAAKTIEALKNRISYLKAIASKANRTTLRRIADATCMSKLFYGIELFGLDLCNSFQTTYNQIVRVTSGALQSSPITSLVVEAGELPLKLRMSETLIRRYCRIEEKSSPFQPHRHLFEAANNALSSETGQQLPDIAKLLRVANRPWHSQTVKIDWAIKHRFKKGQNPKSATALVSELLHTKYNNHDKLYTDGSKCNNRVGLGVVGRRIKVEKVYHFNVVCFPRKQLRCIPQFV